MKRYPTPGTRIYARHMGKHAVGTVTAPPPLSGDEYKRRGLVTYRCDWNKGEHLVKLADIRLVKPKLYKPERDSKHEAVEANIDEIGAA